MATRPPGRNASRILKCTRISGAARIDKSRRVLRNFGELSIPRNDTCLEGTADDYFAKNISRKIVDFLTFLSDK